MTVLLYMCCIDVFGRSCECNLPALCWAQLFLTRVDLNMDFCKRSRRCSEISHQNRSVDLTFKSSLHCICRRIEYRTDPSSRLGADGSGWVLDWWRDGLIKKKQKNNFIFYFNTILSVELLLASNRRFAAAQLLQAKLRKPRAFYLYNWNN